MTPLPAKIVRRGVEVRNLPVSVSIQHDLPADSRNFDDADISVEKCHIGFRVDYLPPPGKPKAEDRDGHTGFFNYTPALNRLREYPQVQSFSALEVLLEPLLDGIEQDALRQNIRLLSAEAWIERFSTGESDAKMLVKRIYSEG